MASLPGMVVSDSRGVTIQNCKQIQPEQGSFSMTFGCAVWELGPPVVTVTVTVGWVKVGNQMTLLFPNIASLEDNAGGALTGEIVSTTAIPAALRPHVNIWTTTPFLSNDTAITNGSTMCFINATTGIVSFFPGIAAAGAAVYTTAGAGAMTIGATLPNGALVNGAITYPHVWTP